MFMNEFCNKIQSKLFTLVIIFLTNNEKHAAGKELFMSKEGYYIDVHSKRKRSEKTLTVYAS